MEPKGRVGVENIPFNIIFEEFRPSQGPHCKPLDALSTCYDGMFHCYSIAVHALSESVGVPNTCQAIIFLPSGALAGTVNGEIFKVT